MRLWYIGADGPTATPITIRTPHGLVTGIAFAGKGDWLATGNDRGNVQLWNLQVDELIRLANAADDAAVAEARGQACRLMHFSMHRIYSDKFDTLVQAPSNCWRYLRDVRCICTN